MNHSDHVRLISQAIPETPGIWADLGSGTGAFTLALSDLAHPETVLYSIDRDAQSLERQRQEFERNSLQRTIHFIKDDFTNDINLPLLDGVIMANSLHYVSDQVDFLKRLVTRMKPGGTFILVEYNTNTGNQWVPYPLSIEAFKALAEKAGLIEVQLLDTEPSHFLNEIYAASAKKPVQ
jgi:ubiquinone/menaquinone biosynthesis C-methylase UbiE